MNRRLPINRRPLLLTISMVVLGAVVVAQWQPGRGRSGGFRRGGRPMKRMPSRDEFPTWENGKEHKSDVFTFVRIKFDSYGEFGWWNRWDNDYPDSDWNFSFRLQQVTSMKVDPDGKVLRFTDPELFNHPFVYLCGCSQMLIDHNEASALRRYLLNGGFMMVDDFWSPASWRHIYEQMKKVFPDRKPQELTIDHEIFHIVFDLKAKPQVTDIRTWRQGYSFEYWHGDPEGDEEPHFWAYFDDHGRMVAIFCQNNDLGDGWEREGENEEYFRKFSEKWSYPMGINIVTYAMTH